MRWIAPTIALPLATVPAGATWARDGGSDALRRLKRPSGPETAPPAPFDLDNLSEAQRQAIAGAAERQGQNCPTVARAVKDSEDATGWVIRVSCTSADGRHRWDLRLTGYPHGKPHFAPWR